MGSIVGVIFFGLLLLDLTHKNVRRFRQQSRPVTAEVRSLRASLRDAPRTGRFDRFPSVMALTEDMRREVAASEGFTYISRAKGTQYFEYHGAATEELPDA